MEKLLEDIRTFFFTGFEVSIHHLKNPTHIFVRDFYIRALIELDVDDENVIKGHLFQRNINNEEVGIIAEINLAKVIRTAFQLNDFGLMDLLVPDKKRTVQHIRAVMNFLQFADARVSLLNPHMERYQGLKAKLDALKKQKDMLSQKANELALDRNKLATHTQELGEMKNDMNNKILHLNHKKKELTSKKTSLEDALKKEKKNLASLTQQIAMEDKRISELKDKIVDHPEMDENNLEDIRNQLAKISDIKEVAKNKIKEKKNEKVKLVSFSESVNDELIPTLAAFEDEINEIRDVEQQVINKVKEMKRLQSVKGGLSNKLSSHKGNLAEEAKRKDKLLKDIQRSEVDLKKAVEDVERKYDEEMAKFKISKKEMKKMDEINKTIEDIKKRVNRSQEMFRELFDLCGVKENEFHKFIDDIVEGLKSRNIEFKDLIIELESLKKM